MKSPLPPSGSRLRDIALALAFASALTAAAGAAAYGVISSQFQRQLETKRGETIDKLARIRADMESMLTGSLTLTQGMAATLYAHGALSDDEFVATARQLSMDRDDVRNMAIAYGTVLKQVYPVKGNEKAVGLDYRSNPQQWPAVEKAITDGKTVVVGPLSLVQGGLGIISRTPVYRPSHPGAAPSYFGLVSIVIDLETLLDRSGLNDKDRGIDVAFEADGEILHGRTDLRSFNPVSARISFPGGTWMLLAVPSQGWPQSWWHDERPLVLSGLGMMLVVAALSFGAALVWLHRTKLLASLQESESRYRNLMETAPAAIVAHRHGRLIFANREALRLIGADDAQSLIDRPVLDLIHPDYHPVVRDRIGSLRQPGDESPPIRQKLIRLNGSVVDADVASSAVMIDGELAVLAIAVDASRTVRAEAQLQSIFDDLQRSNDELRQFTAAASHDLQEPLRQIATYVQMLERRYSEALDKDGREFIDFAVAGVMRMRRLLHDLGTYTQLQTAGTPLKRLDLSAIVDAVEDEHRPTIERLGARISHCSMPAVMGDEKQMNLLFSNLLDNALRYSRSGVPPVISYNVTRQGAFWRFSISDNGIGIAPEYQTAIFNVFTRLHGAGQTDGSGFGLAICRRVVERHGGRIWLESQPEVGSTFYFTLPTA
ncbi:ATP-binding protein [Magnetospirillum sp. 64-120]|uniref:ATP-binding protein n=1 Tax=Magnetospirillum sp. 64-120 TaxID=1895778 RepID=UPI0025B949DB|nr:ATP-binding protein [Magnetospirillum sp. 64-120]